jgi:hypothetical protein
VFIIIFSPCKSFSNKILEKSCSCSLFKSNSFITLLCFKKLAIWEAKFCFIKRLSGVLDVRTDSVHILLADVVKNFLKSSVIWNNFLSILSKSIEFDFSIFI